MPTINFTGNTTLNLTVSSADQNATLNRYLKDPLSFATPAGLDAIAAKNVGELDPSAFPITASAAGTGQFAVEGASLSVQPGASASIGLLTGEDAADFFSSLQWQTQTAVGIVSFGLKGTLSGGLAVTGGDFCFGITKAASVAMTSFYAAPGTDTFAEAAQRAVAALTIPHDLNDLRSLLPNTACRIEAASSLKFTASVTYNILNNPLATISISNLPSLAVEATAGATLEGAATHTSDHTVTIAKLPNGLIHMSVSMTKTDDLETSLTVSAGVAANVGHQDALAFLIDKISPNSTAELKKIQADMPPGKAQQLSGDIKEAIDAVLCSSLAASLKTALDDSQAQGRVFLYEIDLTALDEGGTAALQSALAGDFTTMTSWKAALAGIRELDSALTVTSSVTHSLTLHLLGIFNWGSTSAFVEKSKVDYTKDTHEIVLSDETIEVVTNNLDSQKLREVVVKGITLTLPASANTPDAAAPIRMVFFDRQAAASASTMRQFANVLDAAGASGAAGAASLLSRDLKNYGASSLYLGLNLAPQQCRQLFIDGAGRPYIWTTYLGYACRAQASILADDAANEDRRRLFTAGEAFWKALRDAGAAPRKIELLAGQKIRQEAIVDVVALIWWSSAMEDYATALATGQSLVQAGKEVVKKSTGGFDEPWLVVATWNMLQKPAMESLFTSSLLKGNVGAPGSA